MHKKSSQHYAIDLFKIVILDQSNEEPESEALWAVEEELCDDKVHTLYVADISPVVAECDQYTP